MNSSLRSKLILSFVLVFLAGLACGFFGGLHAGPAVFKRMHRGGLPAHMKAYLQRELRLSAEQMKQISPIVDSTSAQLETQRERTSREVRAILDEAHREIAPFLTPEQRERLDRMEKRHREMRRRGFMPPPPP